MITMDPDERHHEEVLEARRWRPFMDALFALLPEVWAWLVEFFESDDPSNFTPGAAWCEITSELLGADSYPRRLDEDLWPRVLGFLEVVEEAVELLKAQGQQTEEDVTTLGAFATAGIVYDVTRNASGLQQLLPWMGPRTVSSARAEVEVHDRPRTASRGQEVDWSVASTKFSPVSIEPGALLPLPG